MTARVEGINIKIKVLKRKAHGYRDMEYLELKRRILPTIVLMIFCVGLIPPVIIAEEKQVDVLYLKDGTVIQGEIVEPDLESHVTIRTIDGRLLIYSVEEVRKIAEETLRIEPIQTEDSIREEKIHRKKIMGGILIGPGCGLITAGGLTWNSREETALRTFLVVSGLVFKAIGLSVVATLQDESGD